MINYWYEVTKEGEQYTLVVKANSDIINVQEHFNAEADAELYAEIYIRGFKDGRGEYES